MGLLNFGKKEKKKACCCGGGCMEKATSTSSAAKTEDAVIQILGGGCKKCNELEANVKQVLNELKLDLSVEHITDFAEIAALGVISTPALMINGTVVSYGKVLSAGDVKEAMKKAGMLD